MQLATSWLYTPFLLLSLFQSASQLLLRLLKKNAWLSSAQVLYVHDIFNDSRPLPAIPLPLTQKNQTP